MKKVFFGIIIFFYFANIGFAAQTCEYADEILECQNAQNPRSIEDFVCVQGDYTNTVIQIVLDKEFQKIDTEVEMYLSFLEKNKNYYFGPNAQKSYPEAIDDIWGKFATDGYFGKRYGSWCRADAPENEKTVVSQALACSNNAIQSNKIKEVFQTSTCNNLVETKLEVYRSVALQILKLNKNQIKKDTYKTIMQDQRGKYDTLINLMNVNLSFIEKIWAKVPYLVKDAR